jgi:hypothetical protein
MLRVVVFNLKATVKVLRPAYVFAFLLKTAVKAKVEIIKVKATRTRYSY